MAGRAAGRGLMMAGALVAVIGLGGVLVRTLAIPGYWMPVFVGLGLFLAGALLWATSRHNGR